MKLILIILSIFVITSCGKEKTIRKFKSEAIPEGYSYYFEEEDCDTGEQIFYRLKDACEGVLNDELNNYCAKEERQQLYESSCAMYFNEE